MFDRLNPSILLIAVVVAVTIKVAVYEQVVAGERFLQVPVTYNPPSADITFYDQVESVKVRLRGSSADLNQVTAFNVEVVADIPRGKLGTVSLSLDESAVRIRTSGDFDVLSIEPNRFSLQVERRVQRMVPVKARFEGEPAAGARTGVPIIRPPTAEISGPASKVETLQALEVVVNLDGHALTFEETVHLTSPDPLVRILKPQRVVVHIPMDEPQLSNYEELIQENPEP